MGISWSKRHHRHDNHHHPPPLPPPSSSSHPLSSITLPPTTPPPPQPPPPPPPYNPVPQPPSYAFAANAPHSTTQPPPQHPYPAPYPPPSPPPPLPPYNYTYSFSNHHLRPVNMIGQYSNYRPYYVPQISGSAQSAAPPPLQPAPYVDHQSAKKIKNDVNVHKDTIRLQLDPQYPDCHLVSFTFDALVDGSITIFYFAKEGNNCRFTPLYPEIKPVKIPFQKGLGQKFCQPSGTGMDLGFFDTDDLSRPISGEDIYPLVLSAESIVPSSSTDGSLKEEAMNASSPHAQITQAVLEKKDDENFQVKVVKQILWIDGARYELREIFGISDSSEAAVSDVESGKECIICLTEVKNTAVLPCRHMCMCSDCAKELRLQTNKCPVCRQPIEELLEIKVDQEAGV